MSRNEIELNSEPSSNTTVRSDGPNQRDYIIIIISNQLVLNLIDHNIVDQSLFNSLLKLTTINRVQRPAPQLTS